MKRKANAVWSGTGLEGTGALTMPSGVFNKTPYGFKARFQNEDGTLGTNPEELIAAAHAGCLAMALSFQIVGAGFTAELLEVDATITMDPVEGGFAFTSIVLDLEGKVPGMTAEKFSELAEIAKSGCPVSKALSATPIHLNVKFVD